MGRGVKTVPLPASSRSPSVRSNASLQNAISQSANAQITQGAQQTQSANTKNKKTNNKLTNTKANWWKWNRKKKGKNINNSNVNVDAEAGEVDQGQVADPDPDDYQQKDCCCGCTCRMWGLLIAGAVCSGTVGTLYGYSYVRGDLQDYLFKVNFLANADCIANSAYYIGFFGQYMWFIPGLIFDHAGPVITILYGSIVVTVGFVLLGLGITSASLCWLIGVGIFMAGQGSKGLGFGTLLGALNTFPDWYTATISGVYLGFDWFSAIFAMIFYDGWFSLEDKTDYSSYPFKGPFGNNLSDFFFYLGIFIGAVGATTTILYCIWYRSDAIPDEIEKPLNEIQNQEIEMKTSSNLKPKSRSRQRRANNEGGSENANANELDWLVVDIEGTDAEGDSSRESDQDNIEIDGARVWDVLETLNENQDLIAQISRDTSQHTEQQSQVQVNSSWSQNWNWSWWADAQNENNNNAEQIGNQPKTKSIEDWMRNGSPDADQNTNNGNTNNQQTTQNKRLSTSSTTNKNIRKSRTITVSDIAHMEWEWENQNENEQLQNAQTNEQTQQSTISNKKNKKKATDRTRPASITMAEIARGQEAAWPQVPANQNELCLRNTSAASWQQQGCPHTPKPQLRMYRSPSWKFQGGVHMVSDRKHHHDPFWRGDRSSPNRGKGQGSQMSGSPSTASGARRSPSPSLWRSNTFGEDDYMYEQLQLSDGQQGGAGWWTLNNWNWNQNDDDLAANKAPEKKTYWLGVILAYILLFLGESQGLSYNSVISWWWPWYNKSIRGVFTIEMLREYNMEEFNKTPHNLLEEDQELQVQFAKQAGMHLVNPDKHKYKTVAQGNQARFLAKVPGSDTKVQIWSDDQKVKIGDEVDYEKLQSQSKVVVPKNSQSSNAVQSPPNGKSERGIYILKLDSVDKVQEGTYYDLYATSTHKHWLYKTKESPVSSWILERPDRFMITNMRRVKHWDYWLQPPEITNKKVVDDLPGDIKKWIENGTLTSWGNALTMLKSLKGGVIELYGPPYLDYDWAKKQAEDAHPGLVVYKPNEETVDQIKNENTDKVGGPTKFPQDWITSGEKDTKDRLQKRPQQSPMSDFEQVGLRDVKDPSQRRAKRFPTLLGKVFYENEAEKLFFDEKVYFEGGPDPENPDKKVDHLEMNELKKKYKNGKYDGPEPQTYNEIVKAWKMYLTIAFTLGNACGRLGFGLLSDQTGKCTIWMPKAFYLFFCVSLYTILFIIMWTSSDCYFGTPVWVVVLTALFGITYGGIYTIVTAYFKQICAKNNLGFLLGWGLMILAIGGFIFGVPIQACFQTSETWEFADDDVGQWVKQGFFVIGWITNAICIPVGVILWLNQVHQIKWERDELQQWEEEQKRISWDRNSQVEWLKKVMQRTKTAGQLYDYYNGIEQSSSQWDREWHQSISNNSASGTEEQDQVQDGGTEQKINKQSKSWKAVADTNRNDDPNLTELGTEAELEGKGPRQGPISADSDLIGQVGKDDGNGNGRGPDREATLEAGASAARSGAAAEIIQEGPEQPK